MARERRLPAAALAERRHQVDEQRQLLQLELRLLPAWRPWRRRRLQAQLVHLDGLAEGMRLASSPYSPSDPGKPSA